ncbi:cytochrome b5 domain-containing protein [Youngiibacter fragilis]|uniref:Cytochrome B5 n=1 Tax=Youngiibacter fragilis 232.1 TaxID=994573 RepID=V7HZF6_9CLOT|nr:cytochrome b5 domain-containing protein [Youngiibacter fragilis]ETA79370.1 cytochrome B5 [Youngiibacter fragilis 232.1]
MIRNKKMMAASLALVLGTFALAGCTRSEAAGAMDNSVAAAQTEGNGEDAVSSATGGKGIPGEKGHKVERGTRPDEETYVVQTIPDKTFTLEELSKFDGKDGADAYIAIDGIVYNVTDADGWTEGEHEGYFAGQDLTAAFESSPHKASMLNALEIMGKLAE